MTTPNTSFQHLPFLREQRYFPYDNVKDLAKEVDLSYIDIALNVNQRTIGVHALNYPLVNGERFYLAGSSYPQDGMRQIYTFTTIASIPHGLNTNDITNFTLCYGSYNDSAGDFNGIIFANSLGITNQLTFYITPTNIVFVNGGIPSPLVSGIIILNWISQY